MLKRSFEKMPIELRHAYQSHQVLTRGHLDTSFWRALAMSEQRDKALRKALACELHARQAPSDFLRDKFRRLRDSWIRIANADEIATSLGAGPRSAGRQATRR